MDNLSIAAAAGLRARMEALDLVAHNIANAGTSGFKASHELYSQAMSEAGFASPVLGASFTDSSQGHLTPTGSPADFALDGPGWFRVEGTAGPLYTRNGSFHMLPSGRLATAEGYEVDMRTDDGGKISLDPLKPFTVAADQSISQNGARLGRLRVVEFDAAVEGERRGGSYVAFALPREKEAREARVLQGYVEASNVSAPTSAVKLVSVMRQFEMLNRALQLGAEMNRRAIEEVARVNN